MILMTEQDKVFLDRINGYAADYLPDLDPEKTQISVQLELLKPIMQEIATETNESVESIFIRYMDLASLASLEKQAKFKDDFKDLDIQIQ